MVIIYRSNKGEEAWCMYEQCGCIGKQSMLQALYRVGHVAAIWIACVIVWAEGESVD